VQDVQHQRRFQQTLQNPEASLRDTFWKRPFVLHVLHRKMRYV